MTKNQLSTLLAFVFSFLISASMSQAESFEESFKKEVSVFLDSLNDDQKKACLLPVDSERRWKMQYTGGVRGGVQIKSLTDDQRKQFEKVIRLVLSDHGWKKANLVAKQDGEQGLGKYYVACFGDPRKGGNYAFRLAEHHLTVVHLEVEKGNVKEFGPILLGANPPNLWNQDERKVMDIWQNAKDEKLLIPDKAGIASRLMKEGDGVSFTSLNAQAQESVKKAFTERISIFQPALQKRIEKLHTERGGWNKSRVAFYKEPALKQCRDGGRWDFKCGLPGMVWDFETSRGHIHSSIVIKAQE